MASCMQSWQDPWHSCILLQLQSKGVAMPEDGGTVSDPELLMDVMEQREAVEDTNDVNVLHDMLAANQKSEQTTVQVHSQNLLTAHTCLHVPCCATHAA